MKIINVLLFHKLFNSNAYQAVTSLPHDTFKNHRECSKVKTSRFCCVKRTRSSQPDLYGCVWKARLTRFDQSEKRWNERSQDGGPIARGNRMYSSCLFYISACGKLAWHGLTNQSSDEEVDRKKSRWLRSCGVVAAFPTAAVAKRVAVSVATLN